MYDLSSMLSWFALWLVIVPVVIFGAKPHTALWIKSARIIFLFLLFAVMREVGLSLSQNFYELPLMHFSLWDFWGRTILFAIWGILLCNLYIGWCEFIWRCFYKQWSKKIMNNIQYGMVSNISVFLAVFTTCAIPIIAVYIWIKVSSFKIEEFL